MSNQYTTYLELIKKINKALKQNKTKNVSKLPTQPVCTMLRSDPFKVPKQVELSRLGLGFLGFPPPGAFVPMST